jgi:hypothetical protein
VHGIAKYGVHDTLQIAVAHRFMDSPFFTTVSKLLLSHEPMKDNSNCGVARYDQNWRMCW